MMTLLRIVVVALLLLPVSFQPARALDTPPDQFDQKLKRFEPEAVEAALAYAKMLNLKEQYNKGIPLMRDQLMRQIGAKNPSMNKENTEAFIDAFFQSALVDKADLIEKATVLIMLDLFSKDELIAVSQFYLSPVGKGILGKMPQMMGKLQELQGLVITHIVPEALKDAQAKMKARGVEMKL